MNPKLSKKQIEEVRKLKLEGKKDKEITEKFGISRYTIRYHCVSEEERKKMINKRMEYFRNLSPEKKIEVFKKRNEYNKNYRRERYKYDPIFREKIKKYNREWQRKNDNNRKKRKKTN